MHNYEQLQTSNPAIQKLIIDITNKIKDKIMTNNIDILELSQKLYLEPEVLIDMLNYPVNKYSAYLEILETIESN